MNIRDMMKDYDMHSFHMISSRMEFLSRHDSLGFCIVYGIDFRGKVIKGMVMGPTIFMYCNFEHSKFTGTKLNKDKPFVFAGCQMKENVDDVDFLRRN